MALNLPTEPILNCGDGKCGMPACLSCFFSKTVVIKHVWACEAKTNGDCEICDLMEEINRTHALQCKETDAECSVPFCTNVKQNRRQQASSCDPQVASTSAAGSMTHLFSAQNWQKSISADLRNRLVHTLVEATLPTPGTGASDNRIGVVINARNIENKFFEVAGSRSTYYHLIADEFYKIHTQKDDNREQLEKQPMVA